MALCVFGFPAAAEAQSRRYDDALSAWEASAATGATPPATYSPATGSDDILGRAAFIHAVLERNPSLESTRQAWRGALAEHAQRNALDDPMLEYSFAPLSIASSNVPYGQVVTVSQKLPWPGKRALAGDVALAEAEVLQEDFEAARRRLALMASLLFDRYYAVERSLEINDQHQALVEEIKEAAHAQYATGRGSQQEPLQAEVELAHVEHQRIVLSSERAIVVAQMNGLLHQPPETALPAPPAELDLPDLAPATSAQLQEEALSHRPELRAQHATIRGQQAARDLAARESYPDFGVMASYNSMWEMPEHQWMAGVSLNIPLQLAKRRGAVDQAQARIAQARAQLLSASDQIRVEVAEAHQRFIEAGHVIRLYRSRLLPASRAQIDAAKSGYVTGQTGFQALIDAERSLRNVELSYLQALATLGERRAQLVQVLGRVPGLDAERGAP